MDSRVLTNKVHPLDECYMRLLVMLQEQQWSGVQGTSCIHWVPEGHPGSCCLPSHKPFEKTATEESECVRCWWLASLAKCKCHPRPPAQWWNLFRLECNSEDCLII